MMKKIPYGIADFKVIQDEDYYYVDKTMFIPLLEAAGCEYVRTQGDHLVYHSPGAIRPVVIPRYKEIPVFIIKNNMKVIGMSRETYFQLLENI